MHPFRYVVTNNLASYQFLKLRYSCKIEGNQYLHFAMFCICRHFENRAPRTKPSSKERVIKFPKLFQPQNAECINQ